MTKELTENQEEIIEYIQENNEPSFENVRNKFNKSDFIDLVDRNIIVYKESYRVSVNTAKI